jgi:feruloyl-CoA synthase
MPPKAVPHLDDVDFSAVRAFSYGGGPISPALARELVRAYRTDRFHQLFGMTEAGPTGIMFPPEELEAKAGTIGKAAMPTVDVPVVKLDGGDAGPGDTGEIWIRSGATMVGYLDNPEATPEAMEGDWYKTGDLARINGDGFPFIVDRVKDFIVTGGENLYCKEVEDAMAEVPAIAHCAVLGLPHPEWGETVAAAVVLHPGEALDLPALTEALRSRIAAYKIPRRLMVAATLPITPTGKVMKHVLRGMFTGAPTHRKQDPKEDT